MADVLTPLTLDFLAWLAGGPRPYGEVMEAWRTSCPRLTIWEDAIGSGLVAHAHVPGRAPLVALTPRGEAFLAARRAKGGALGSGCAPARKRPHKVHGKR